jgi:hypothetical protein
MAQFRLKQRLEMIDYREDVLLPELEAFKSGKSVLGLPAGQAFDIRIQDADSDHSQTDAANCTRSEN